MDPQALEALKASIQKWEKNARVRKPENVKLGTLECPLCAVFFSEECVGCPVFKKTRGQYCSRSPYGEASDAQHNWQKGKGTRQQFVEAAKVEVDFLRSLLPEGETCP